MICGQWIPQGSGVPQPWAILFSPFRAISFHCANPNCLGARQLGFRNVKVHKCSRTCASQPLARRFLTELPITPRFNFKRGSVPKFNSYHYPHLFGIGWSNREIYRCTQIPTGFHNTARGCGTPLPRVSDDHHPSTTPKGLRPTAYVDATLSG